MMTIDIMLSQISGLNAPDLQRWIENDWVRPERPAGAYLFHDIDVARVRLICELRDDLQIDEDALPVVLHLLDQVYSLRRHMRELGSAIEVLGSPEMRLALQVHLAAGSL